MESAGLEIPSIPRRSGETGMEILIDMADRQKFTREWQLSCKGPGALPRGGGGGARRPRGPLRVVRNDFLDLEDDAGRGRFPLAFLLAAPRRWTEQIFAWVEAQGR